jgi:hypothetical protein
MVEISLSGSGEGPGNSEEFPGLLDHPSGCSAAAPAPAAVLVAQDARF